jgi:hypothetical protein
MCLALYTKQTDSSICASISLILLKKSFDYYDKKISRDFLQLVTFYYKEISRDFHQLVILINNSLLQKYK